MTTATPMASPEPPLSEGARVIDAFFAPTKTFRDINRSASWWLPFLLIVIVSYGFVFTVDKKVGFENIVEHQVRTSKRADQFDQLSAEQQQKQLEFATKIARYFSYGTPAVSLVLFLIMALVLMGSYSFGAGAQVSFSKSMAVVVYSNLVGTVKSLLAIIALLAGANTENFNAQNPAATNLGFLIDPLQHKVLYALGSSVDIITFWVLAMLAVGFTYICKVKKGVSFAIILGWWVLVTLIGVGIAAIT